jgi:hypothetical protein
MHIDSLQVVESLPHALEALIRRAELLALIPRNHQTEGKREEQHDQHHRDEDEDRTEELRFERGPG